jgi:hypothetical protein
MEPRRKRLLLFGYLIAGLLLVISLFAGNYASFLSEGAGEPSVDQGVVKREVERIQQAHEKETGTLEDVRMRARRFLQDSELSHPRGFQEDNIQPILDDMHRQLHEPLYKNRPQDK